MYCSNKEELKIKFLSNIKVLPSGCWYWFTYRDENGYGRCWYNGRLHKAHRISLYLYKDFDLHSPLLGCHTCDNRGCVNPDHLFIGTHRDNVRDCINKKRFNAAFNRAKLQISDVEWIRQNSHTYTTRQLAEKFNVSKSHIRRIKRGESWNKGMDI